MNTAKYNRPFFDAMYERVKEIFEYIGLHYNGGTIVLITGFTWKFFFSVLSKCLYSHVS